MGPRISQGERSAWQRRAAGELAAILEDCRDLPCIGWTVSPAGAVLVGRVGGLAPAGQVRQAFDAWQAALALDERWEHVTGAGTAYLHAAARRSGVRVRLAAAVLGEAEAGQ
jgi:hypothetical protein